jgi:hypothetical protein
LNDLALATAARGRSFVTLGEKTMPYIKPPAPTATSEHGRNYGRGNYKMLPDNGVKQTKTIRWISRGAGVVYEEGKGCSKAKYLRLARDRAAAVRHEQEKLDEASWANRSWLIKAIV